MAELSHQKAQAFLQTAADNMLAVNEQSLLDSHLAGCKECSAYANNLKSLEGGLRRVSHAHWDKHQPSLDLGAVTNPPPTKTVWNNLLGLTQGMGKITILAALVLGYFLIVNLGGGQIPISGTETPTMLPTPNTFTSSVDTSPTPSAQLALTGLMTLPCDPIIHIVQTADTLDSIAIHYRIPKEAIMDYNNLTVDDVLPGTKLSIPVCYKTPSQTTSTPTNTITVTPLGSLVFPTQPD
jgi:LysM repeat protein